MRSTIRAIPDSIATDGPAEAASDLHMGRRNGSSRPVTISIIDGTIDAVNGPLGAAARYLVERAARSVEGEDALRVVDIGERGAAENELAAAPQGTDHRRFE